MHPTFKHLEDRIRLGGLTIGQWGQLLACAVAAYALSRLLPLPGSWSVSVAVTLCGLPAAGAIAFMESDFDVLGWTRAALRLQRAPKRYPGSLAAESGGAEAFELGVAREEFDAEALWD